MSKILADPHKTLIRLVGLNVAFDVLSIPFWIALPSLQTAQSTSTLTVNTSIAIVDAAIAAALFAIALLGIIKKQKWGALLVIAISIVNRAIAVFLYEFSVAFGFWVIWTVILVVLAYLDLRKLSAQPQTPVTAQAQTA